MRKISLVKTGKNNCKNRAFSPLFTIFREITQKCLRIHQKFIMISVKEMGAPIFAKFHKNSQMAGGLEEASCGSRMRERGARPHCYRSCERREQIRGESRSLGN